MVEMVCEGVGGVLCIVCMGFGEEQGCINRSILPSGMGARGVSSEHVENHAPVLGEPCSGSWRTVLWFLENRAPVLGEPCSGQILQGS